MCNKFVAAFVEHGFRFFAIAIRVTSKTETCIGITNSRLGVYGCWRVDLEFTTSLHYYGSRVQDSTAFAQHWHPCGFLVVLKMFVEAYNQLGCCCMCVTVLPISFYSLHSILLGSSTHFITHPDKHKRAYAPGQP